MSKSSRRPSRAGRIPPHGTSASGSPGDKAAAANPPGTGGGPAAGSGGAGSGTAGTGRDAAHRSTSPAGTARAGRRERPRTAYRDRSFLERHRQQVVIGGISAVVVIAAAFLFLGASQPAYACTTLSTPAPSASAAPGTSPQIGQSQPDMGRGHVNVGSPQTYAYCPPASGNHYNAAGQGPIQARFYSPDETALPEGWIHNLEHGAMVVLYSCKGGCPDAATLQKLKDFASISTFPKSPVCGVPPGQIGPVVARFDQISTKFAAVVWDRILLQDNLDTGQLLAFFKQYGELYNPELQCAAPSNPPPLPSPVSPSPS
ncbi:MAG: DUF3105 domain-containing protein [Chloroflexi bacterium]|nr:DUF3105 domain-containing protein [Chloroflexota bacterium]